MKIKIFILICFVFLCGCNFRDHQSFQSNEKPKTTQLVKNSDNESKAHNYSFKGSTNHWDILMVFTEKKENEEEIKVTYEYKGDMEFLKTFTYIKATYHTNIGDGSVEENSVTGLKDREYTSNSSTNGANISKDFKPDVTIILSGKNGSQIKESTKLSFIKSK